MNSVVLTGIKGNLGVVVEAVLHQRGWNVIGMDRHDADLTDAEAVKHAITAIPTPLTAVVHLVGGIKAGTPIEETSTAVLMDMFMLNVVTAYNVMSAAIPAMKRAGGGCFVSMGAQSVLHPVKDRAAYSAAKSALVSLTLSLAEEGRPHNIRANSILPSIIKTPSNMEWATEEESKQWVTREQIASAIADLIDPSSGVSGAVIPMFGHIPF